MMDRTIGRTISHYTILDRLGAGGMGVVYKALDSKLDRYVAVKFLPPHLGNNEIARARFIAEAKAASALDHPNIGTIFEIDESPDIGLFIVMAYYPGQSLAERIRVGPLPLAIALDFAVQTGEGLAKAHEHRIVHRDIKPGNLMVTTEGIIKILDFGLAFVQSGGVDEAGSLVGTLRFMSPERLSDGPVDHRCDIWALGVVLYNMITGQLPFHCADMFELMHRIQSREPAPFSAPPAIRTVISKALAKHPSARYQHVGDVVSELREVALRLPAVPDVNESESTRKGWLPVQFTTAPTRPVALVRAGERRQLTVLSCELADWPTLAERLDSEQLQQMLMDYQALCAQAIQPFEGHVAQTLDSRMTVHFGFPKAHEDDALRALLAGLDIIAGMNAFEAECRRTIRSWPRAPLNVRIGVHTGEVVTSDQPASAQRTVTGVVGTLADEAAALAGFREMVITEDTYRLVKGFFNVEPIGTRQLAGRSKPVTLYQAISRTGAASRIAAVAPFGLTEFVGRSEELEALLRLWEGVTDGGARVVLLSGEAGIGKSRLVEAVKERLQGTPHRLLDGRCSPYHQNSPLFPVVDLLSRTFELDRAGSREDKRARLRDALARHGFSSATDVQAFVSLFSLSQPDALVQPASPRQRGDTLQLLLRLLLRLSLERPLLLVVEDLHWSDPSTLDFLTQIVDQGLAGRILTILTFRPEFHTPWDHRVDLNQFTLGRLSYGECTTMVERLTRGKPLPPEISSQIIGNSDGVPLFLEELTKLVLESDVGEETTDSYELRKPVTPLSVPTTLRDSLMARLDRLGGAKQVAQLASVLGRTFSYAWLESISPLAEQALRRHLATLVDAQLLYQQDASPDLVYTFKHALIKDAAYFSLLNRTRQHYHERLARTLERRYPELKQTEPELLARHYADAGRIEKAVAFWAAAGHQAIRRSANVEAAAHFREALQLLGSLRKTPKRRQLQLELVIALGAAQVATMGFAAVPVGEAFGRARELCERVGATPELFDAVQGLYAFHLVRAELRTSLDFAGRLIELAARLDDEPRRQEATLRRGISLYALGDLASASTHLEQALTPGVSDEPRETALRFGQDRTVASLSHLSVVVWLLGQPDRAVALAEEARGHARARAHPFSVAFALLYSAIVASFRKEPIAVQEHTVALAALCQEQGFAYRLAQSQILDGWVRATRDGDAGAIRTIQIGIEKTRATGAQVLLPYYLALLTEAALVLREMPLGLSTAREALAVVQRTEECFFQAELERLYGELLHASGAEGTEVVAWLSRSLATARRQCARSFELRTLTSLARLAPDGAAGRWQVGEVLQLFGEGVDTPDTRAARELLKQFV